MEERSQTEIPKRKKTVKEHYQDQKSPKTEEQREMMVKMEEEKVCPHVPISPKSFTLT